MSLVDLPRGVFASVTTPVELVERYVGSAELAGIKGDARPEAQLMHALCEGAPANGYMSTETAVKARPASF